jgi:TolA-binding protein
MEEKSESGGQLLLDFAARCAELEYHQAAIRACREVLDRHPQADAAARAQLLIAHSLVALKRYDQALSAFGDLLVRYPKSPQAVEAMYRRGEIYFHHGRALGDAASQADVLEENSTGGGSPKGTASGHDALAASHIDSAQAAYGRLIERFGQSAWAADAAMRIGDCLAIKGDLEEARAAYRRLAYGRGPEQIREQGTYKLAELLFLEGRIEESREAFDELIDSYPQGFYVNDALAQTMLISEGLAEDEEALTQYAAAMLMARQRRYGPALESFGGFEQEFPDSPLLDDVLMQTAGIRGHTGRHQEALADLETLIRDHPESRLCPEALRRVGQIYEHHLQDLPAAREAYERLLSEYPEYLFLNEVRRTLRRLKGHRTG